MYRRVVTAPGVRLAGGRHPRHLVSQLVWDATKHLCPGEPVAPSASGALPGRIARWACAARTWPLPSMARSVPFWIITAPPVSPPADGPGRIAALEAAGFLAFLVSTEDVILTQTNGNYYWVRLQNENWSIQEIARGLQQFIQTGPICRQENQGVGILARAVAPAAENLLLPQHLTINHQLFPGAPAEYPAARPRHP